MEKNEPQSIEELNFMEHDAPQLKGEPPRKSRKTSMHQPVAEAAVIPASNEEKKTEPAEVIDVTPQKEEPKAAQNAMAAAPKPQVGIDDRGRANAGNLDELFRLANALFKGSAFPKWVRSPEQALGICIYLKNLGLEVMTGIQHVCEVNGRLSLWGEGPLAAVRASGKLKSIKEGFYTKDYEEICFKNKNLDADMHFALCVTIRKDNGEKRETWFSIKDEATANKGLDAIWRGYRRTMYKRKARAENLKDNFGDILQGAGISEYDNESSPDMPVSLSAPNESLAEKLKNRTMLSAKNEEPKQETVNEEAVQD